MKIRYPAFPSTFSQELCLPDSKLIFFCSLNFIPGTLWDSAVVFYRWRQKCGTPKAFTRSQWGPEVLSGVLRNWGLHDVPACPLPTSTIEVWCFGESKILLQALDQIHAGWAPWCFGGPVPWSLGCNSHGGWELSPWCFEDYPCGGWSPVLWCLETVSMQMWPWKWIFLPMPCPLVWEGNLCKVEGKCPKLSFMTGRRKILALAYGRWGGRRQLFFYCILNCCVLGECSIYDLPSYL